MTTMTTTIPPRDMLLAILTRFDACEAAREWVASLPATTTAREAWVQCPRGDWMIWLLGRLHAENENALSRQRLVLASCAVARAALPYLDGRPAAVALERLCVAERWCRGESFEGELLAVRRVIASARSEALANAMTAYSHADAAADAYATARATVALYADDARACAARAYAAAAAYADATARSAARAYAAAAAAHTAAAAAAAAAFADAFALADARALAAAADAAAYAADDAAAYDAAAYDAYDAGRVGGLAATADSVRGVIPWSEVEAALHAMV